MACLKSIYVLGQGVFSTGGSLNFDVNVIVISFTKAWDNHIRRLRQEFVDQLLQRRRHLQWYLACLLVLMQTIGVDGFSPTKDVGKIWSVNPRVLKSLLAEHSVRRSNAIRMQAANGVVELTHEITFDIESTTTAEVGKDTPYVLSV